MLIRLLISICLFSSTNSYSFDRTVSSSWLKNKIHIDESDSRIRSGAIIGIREFTDPSTLSFELATQSRFGHVGIFISTEDMMEAYIQAVTHPDIYKDFIKDLVEMIPDQNNHDGGYYDFKKQIVNGKADGSLSFYLSFSNLIERDCIEWFLKKNLKNNTIEEVRKIASDIYNKTSLVQERNEVIKDFFGHDVSLPFDYKGGVILDMSPSIDLLEWATPHFISAINNNLLSVIQPKKNLSIEQVSKILIYRHIMQDLRVKYNFSQSIKGISQQNCSEFVHNAFSLIGIDNIGVEQNMSSLNTKALGGSLKTASVLSGQYSSENRVITPKSVMMSGYSHPSMEVVHDLDFLNIKEPVSDRTLYREWKDTGKLHWSYKALKIMGCGWRQPSDCTQNIEEANDGESYSSSSMIVSGAIGAAIVGVSIAYLSKLFI
ncbi:MAG: hypothetical protein AB8C84_12460 [Oligoflexales bacterium]